MASRLKGMNETGVEMHDLCRELFPICRSITGNGVRRTLSILRQHLPALNIVEVPSGARCFDWEVPPEWNIKDAYVIDPDGESILKFQDCNLHVMGYSTSVNETVSLADLEEHLYSLPEQPDAIPYVTSYYKERWGFCISHNQRMRLKQGDYRVFIDSHLGPGSLTYGELIVLGETCQEVFLSTYVCHPSMANNELSGLAVTTFLAKWLTQQKRRRFTYRIIFIPETIGSIVYLSKHVDDMKANIIAGFNISCVGDDRAYSFMPSRLDNSLPDQIARHVLKYTHPEYLTYSYLDRGSDERQYCSPGINLPVCSIMRSKYGCYPEYHTSLDDLTLVTPSGLAGAYEVLRRALECLEANETLRCTTPCEPQLGKRGLYPTISTKTSAEEATDMMNFLAYADGSLSTLEIAEIIKVPMWELGGVIQNLKNSGLIETVG